MVQESWQTKVLFMTMVSRSRGSLLTLDHQDIRDIQIPPTTKELLNQAEPYLPPNLPGTKRHLPADSIEKM